MNKIKLILDTDIGDDIDDALALALIVRSGAFDLVGVTTVFRDTDKRARLVKKLLTLCGYPDVPVIAGSCDGLEQKYDRTEFCQYTPDLAEERYRPDGTDAPAFLVQCAVKYGRELVIAGIGPYTNLAKAYLLDPKAMSKVGRLVVMGGTFFEHHREWNVLCDIAAAKVLFEADLPLECVGFDVTKHTSLCYRQYRYLLELEGEGFDGALGELARLWSKSTWRAPILHDPLVIYYLMHPDILHMRRVQAAVETDGTFTRGMTVNLDTCLEAEEHLRPAKRILAADLVDGKRLVDEFMRIVFQYR